MDDTENPYLPPGSDESASRSDRSDWDDDEDPREIGKARHVPTVAILMMVHGGLMFLAALCMVAMIVFMVPQLAQQIEIQRPRNPNGLSKEMMMNVLYATYSGIAVLLCIIGGLNFFAGIRNYDYRNRVLGIVSMVANMGSLFFCYCLPLSLGLLIFGLIIYLSPEAEQAFRWRSGQLDN